MSWWRSIGRRRDRDRELDAELRDHVDRLTAEYQRQGVPDAEARRRAAVNFGGLEAIKDYCRDLHPASWLRDLIRDVQYGIRVLSHHKAFTSVAVLSLALGIGATTAIFSLVDAVLLKSLPVRAPGELVLLGEQINGRLGNSFTTPEYRSFAESTTLSGLCAFRPWPGFRVRTSGDAELAMGQLVSGSCFGVLGVRPYLGRLLEPGDDGGTSGAPVAVVSYQFWQTKLGAAPDVVGRELALMGKPFMIVGVTPPEFYGLEPGRAIEITVPLASQPALLPGTPLLTSPDARWLRLIGRRARSQPIEQVAGDLSRRLTLLSPSTAGTGAHRPILSVLSGAQGLNDLRRSYSAPLRILLAAVCGLLLIACVNLAALLLARAKAREHEITLRIALGASRGRVIRQLLAEALLLSIAGSVAGVVLSLWARSTLLAMLSRGRQAITLDSGFDLRLLAFSGLVLAVTTLLFGLWPSLHASRRAVRTATVVHGSSRQVAMLVAAQTAVALVLVVTGALFFRSLSALHHVDAGFRRDSIVLASVRPAVGGIDAEGNKRVYGDIYRRLLSLPQVRSATIAMDTPLGGRSMTIGVTTADGAQSAPQVQLDIVGPRFLETMGIALVDGRDVRVEDDERTPAVVVISASLASRLFGNHHAVGETIVQDTQRLQVVGVAGDVRYDGLKAAAGDTIYRPYTQMDSEWQEELTFAVRTEGSPDALVPALRRTVHAVSADLPIYKTSTLDAQYDAALTSERLLAMLSGYVGGFSLLLVGVGVYGTLAYATARRSRELGVRLALGAARADILTLLLRGAVTPVAAGVVIGWPIALLVGRALRAVLFGVSGSDVASHLAAGGLLLSTGVLAALIPSRCAAMTDPVTALRDQ